MKLDQGVAVGKKIRLSFLVKGSSKNYVTARGGGWSMIFLHIVEYIFRGGGILRNSYVTASAKLRTQKALHSIFSVLWNHQKEK